MALSRKRADQVVLFLHSPIQYYKYLTSLRAVHRVGVDETDAFHEALIRNTLVPSPLFRTFLLRILVYDTVVLQKVIAELP